MKLELEVLASTSIKRKKPWPKVAFLGEVQESLFLLDDELQRLSVLYVPSGKTKRKIPKLTPMLSNVAVLTTTDNGHFLAGLLHSGDIFVWHKDSDTIKYIQGLDEFRPKIIAVQSIEEQRLGTANNDMPRPYLLLCGDASKAVLVLDYNKIYVWEIDPGHAYFNYNSKKNKWTSKSADKQPHLQGSWTSILSAADTPLPDSSFRETSIDASFFISDDMQGLCCMLTFVYTQDTEINISSLLIRWFDQDNVTDLSQPIFSSEWTTVLYPLTRISPTCQPIRSRGSLVARLSHDGQLVAVAVNQGCSHDNKVLFVSPWSDTVMVADMRGSGARDRNTDTHRYYWISDMQWTYNDLFVACVLKQGTMCVLTRLGEPALLQTIGCNLDMGPKPFLPLHPLITVRTAQLGQPAPAAHTDQTTLLSASMEEVKDVKRQRFSIETHPRRPMIIFSDGYMVTVLEIPGDPTCLSLMKGLCVEATHHLRKIRELERVQISLFDSLKKKQDERADRAKAKMAECDNCGYRLGLVVSKNLAKKEGRRSHSGTRYKFESAPQDVLDSNYPSDTEGDISPQVYQFNEGNLDFGDINNLNTTLDYRKSYLDEGLTVPELISRAQMALVLAWNLGASHIGLWTLEHETIVDNVVDNLVQLFSVLLQAKPKVLKQLGGAVNSILEQKGANCSSSSHTSGGKKINKSLVLVLNLFKSVMHTLRLDSQSRHLMVCSTKFTHAAVTMLLSNHNLNQMEARSKTLHGCYIVLTFAEKSLSRIYTSIVNNTPWLNGTLHGKELTQSDTYQSAVFVYTTQGRESLHDNNAEQDRLFSTDQTSVKKRVVSAGSVSRIASTSGVVLERREIGSGWTDDGVVSVELKGVRRLGIAWLILYKTAVENYKALKNVARKTSSNQQQENTSGAGTKSRPKAEMKRIWSLILLIETKVHSLGLSLPSRDRVLLTEAETKLVSGDVDKGQVLMVKELSQAPDPLIKGTKGCRLLLSLLYTLISQERIRSALELTEFLIRQTDVKKAVTMSRQDARTRASLLNLLHQVPSRQRSLPACTISNSAVRHTVQSMARLMAAYFSNRQLFVYPPHAPQKLPPLHVDYVIDDRIMPLHREELTKRITEESLDSAWTTDKTLEYLLLCGALPECVWLADTLGDWKTAFVIGVATVQHHNMCPTLYSKKNKLQLPSHLHPENILKSKLQPLLGVDNDGKQEKFLIDEETNPEHLVASLNEFLLTSTLCDLNILPWLLDGLTKRLKLVAGKFPALVPDSLYLPAPPVYCPQPTPTNESRIPREVLEEVSLRREISSLVQTILIVLEASNTCLPGARWYIHKLLQAYAKSLRFKKNKEADIDLDIQVLQESFLSTPSAFQDKENQSDVHVVLHTVRELCTVVWMLHARDQLSRALRKHTLYRQKMLKRTESVSPLEWQQQCNMTVTWLRHMMPFCHFLSVGADLELSSVLFSLVIEMPGDDDSAKILAQCFWDTERLHPDIQEKLEWLMKDWKKIVLRNKPRNVTLALYYEKACEKFEKIIHRKEKLFGAYDQYVYNNTDENSPSVDQSDTNLYIGSRPFESEESYLKFLDEFYAVTLSKLLDKEVDASQVSQQLPLLPGYAAEIAAKELNSTVIQAVSSFLRKQTTSEAINSKMASSPKRQSPSSRAQSPHSSPKRSSKKKKNVSASQDDLTRPSKRNTGLFRSRSFSDLNENGKNSGVELFEKSPKRSRKRASSHDNLLGEDAVIKDLPPITPRGEAMLMHNKSGGVTPRNRTSTPRKNKTVAIIHRSASVTDLNQSHDDHNRTKNKAAGSNVSESEQERNGPDPLGVAVLEPWVLENMVFDKKYTQINSLLDWLNRWAGRSNINVFDSTASSSGSGSRGKNSYNRQQSVMRIKVSSKMILYCLWQLEQNYENHANQRCHKQTKPSQTTNQNQQPVSKNIEQQSDIAPLKGNKTTDEQNNRVNVKKINKKNKKLNRNIEDIDWDNVSLPNGDNLDNYHGGGDNNAENEEDNISYGGFSEKDISDIIESQFQKELGRDRNILNQKHNINTKWEEAEKDADSDLSDLTITPRPLNGIIKPHEEIRERKKRLRIKDKSLNVILNEKFVFDMNTNMNNANDDTHVTEATNSSLNAGNNRNQNNSSTNANSSTTNQSKSTSSDSGAQLPSSIVSEEEIGRHVGRIVAERMSQGPLGKSTDALISNLSEMIDQELRKTMATLARFEKQKNNKKSLEISGPLHLERGSDLAHNTLSPPSTITPIPNLTLTSLETPRGGGMTDTPRGEGGPGVGGQTNRSMMSTDSTIAEELRTVVRTELKKLIQAQHQGILTMLSSLDEHGNPINPAAVLPSNTKQQTGYDDVDGPAQHKGKPMAFNQFEQSHGMDGPIRAQEYVVLTAQQQHGGLNSSSGLSPSLSKGRHGDHDDDATLTPVSSLSSDLFTDRSPPDVPLTVSQLTKEGPHDYHKPHGHPPVLNGALRELKQLENRHHDYHHQHKHHGNVHHSQQHSNQSQPQQQGKENQPGHFGSQSGVFGNQPGVFGNQTGQFGNQGPPLLAATTEFTPQQQQYITPQYQSQQFSATAPQFLQHQPPQATNQPFGRLFSILRHFNDEMRGSSSDETANMMRQGAVPPPLLGIPYSNETAATHGVRFPPLAPTQAWGEQSMTQQKMDGGNMPLLQPSGAPPHVLHEYHKHDLPERDTVHHTNQHGSVGTGGLPLLHANWGSVPFQNLRDQYGVPRLVPAGELIDYEQRKYNKHAYKKKILQEKIDAKMREVTGKSETPLGVKLLRADLEPFNEKDERDSEARARRRNIKLRKPGEKKHKKSSSSKHKQGTEDTEPLLSTREGGGDTTQYTEDNSLTEDDDLPSDTAVPPQYSPPTKDVLKPETSQQQHRSPRKPETQEPATLHHGYAITPGMFDEYLRKDMDSGAAENFAAVQHHTITMMKQEQQKLRSKTKTVGVGTDVTMDKSTAIAKDTGTDPVGEAISRYYRAKTGGNMTGNILPPDIYMGLQFTEGDQPSSRAFLNVVDINSADMLNEIASTVPPRLAHEIEPQAVDMRGEPIQPTHVMKSHGGSPVRSDMRERSASPRRPGPDHTTLQMLGQPTDSFAPTDEIVSGYRRRTGGHIKKRLMDMDQQFDAIQTMTENIEHDFRTTKVLLNTIEQMGEAIQPSDGLPVTSRSHRGHYSPTTPRSPSGRGERSDRSEAGGLQPSYVRRAVRGEEGPEVSKASTPLGEFSNDFSEVVTGFNKLNLVASTPRQSMEDGLTVEERVHDIRSNIRTEGLRWSGISDIDDIIEEVVAKGDIDVTEFGFNEAEVNMLTNRAINAARVGGEVTNEDLEDIFRKKSPRRRPARTDAEKRQIQEFMERKRAERMLEYRGKLNEMRDKEAKPFKSGQGSQVPSNKQLSEADKLRVSSQSKQREDFAKQRERLATHLMRDILEDKLNDKLPPPPTTPSLGNTGKTVTIRRAGDFSPSRTRTLTRAHSNSPKRESPVRETRQDELLRDSYEYISSGPQRQHGSQGHRSRVDRNHYPFSAAPIRSQHSPATMATKTGTMGKSLEFSGEDQIHVYGIGDDLDRVTEVSEGREQPVEQEAGREEVWEDKENREPERPVYKPKPFTEIVKMRDPQKLAKNRDRSHKPVSYVGRLSEMSTASTQRSQGQTLADKHKLYGSKRLPGSQPRTEQQPRTVKTYQERLHEMKTPANQYSTPIVPRSHRPIQQVPFQPPVKTQPRKTKTYQDQLRELQPPKEMYRSGEGAVRHRSVMRSHAPIHKPKTYSQQLQELQPEQQHGRGHRGAARSRPYADPYTDGDADSAVSPWSMEDDVRGLLYDGEDQSFVTPRDGTDIDMYSDDLRLGEDYTTLVDPSDLADVRSVVSEEGSIMSFIDWDQIDNILADVK